MKIDISRLALIVATACLPIGPALAQAGASASAQKAAHPGPRFGTPHGLPRDGNPLYVPDFAFPPVLKPQGWEAYSDIDGDRAKRVADEVTAISRKSRDDGNQFWGRITGTKYDHMTLDWVEKQFRDIGLSDIRRQTLDMPPLWFPNSWSAQASADGVALSLSTVFPLLDTVGTSPEGRSAEAVWVGLGTDADFVSRDVRGKAVFLYSIATPGGRAHSANWNGAIKRANAAGAAMVFVVMGFPGNPLTQPQGVATTVPTFTVSSDEGDKVRAALGAGKKVIVKATADINHVPNLKTGNVWGVLPGATDETIFIMAHTDSFFEGAIDNASGLAMMMEIAKHYAKIPQQQRRRTMVFVTTPDHHQGMIGMKWIRANYDFSKTALIINCEHPAETQTYLLDSGIITSNTVAARRWYVNGSANLKNAITTTLRDYGVAVYALPEVRPGGELSAVYDMAPSFHTIEHIFYHSTIDTLAMVPANGITSTGRAYAAIIDKVNQMSLEQLRDPTTPPPAKK
jgi:hypothetical protein